VKAVTELDSRLALLLDPHVGILQSLGEVPRPAGAPDFFQFVGRACDTSAFAPQRNFANTGGASVDPRIAAAKAMGEAVERYCGALYDPEELPLSTSRDAGFECVPPGDFALFSPEQYAESGFPYVPFGDDTPVRWVAAFDAADCVERHVPAAMVYVPYFYYQGSGDSPITEPISTGLACGRGPAESALGAVCEVIERDAFTLTWQCMLTPPEIDTESLDPGDLDLVLRFRAAGFAVHLFDITTDLQVPSVMTVLRGLRRDQAAFSFAAASAPDPATAVRKALEELEHTRRYSQQLMNVLPRLEVTEGHDNVLDQVDHLNFWCDHENAWYARFLFERGETVPVTSLPRVPGDTDHARLRHIVRLLADHGHHTLLADLTTADVESAGLSVVRAVVPGLHPLHMGHRYRALGGRRIREVSQRLGYGAVDGAGNPAPHPFP
jgi:ribosomal protein S12 methylthiotransferase accessory factor